MRLKFTVGGMSCAACSARIERVINKIDGVTAQVNLLAGTMLVDFDNKNITPEDIIKTVQKAGFTAEIFVKDTVQKEKKDEHKEFKIRIVLSFIFLVPLMVLSMQHMFGYSLPLKANISALLQFIFTLPIIAVNYKYFTVGFKNLFTGSPNMDSLIALGSSASEIYSVYNLILLFSQDLAGHLYFESAAMILTLITLGKFFESKSKTRATDAISSLKNLVAQTVTVKKEQETIEISAETLMVGDIVVCKAGDSFVADGTVVYGNAGVDESMVTGESLPIQKEIGHRVISGTIIKSGYIEYRAEKTGDDTTLAEIVRLVEDSAATKPPIARLADKISGIFVPTVMGISILTLIVWLLLGIGADSAINFAVSVLVISCPCALGLATPVAIMVGTAVAAKNSLLFKNAPSIEHLHKTDALVLDKTGTITKGELSVSFVKAFIDYKEFIKIALSIESVSEHPIAAAVCRFADSENAEKLPVQNVKTLSGFGIGCDIDGITYYSGNEKFAQNTGVDFSEHKELLHSLAVSGKTPILFFTQNKVIGFIAVSDTVKPTSAIAISELKKTGIDIYMVTGDNELIAKKVAKEVGIDNVIASALPGDKEKFVRELKEKGKIVAMVGDGINDAPALNTADIGVAIGAGTDIAIESADVVLMRNDLLDVLSAVILSRKVINNIKINLFWAFFYNALGIPVAAGVLSGFGIVLTPMFAAAAMSLSSICVVSNALKLKNIKFIRGERRDD